MNEVPAPVDAGEFALDKPGKCFCGVVGTRKFKGYWMCDECGPVVESRYRLLHPVMATRIKVKP